MQKFKKKNMISSTKKPPFERNKSIHQSIQLKFEALKAKNDISVDHTQA